MVSHQNCPRIVTRIVPTRIVPELSQNSPELSKSIEENKEEESEKIIESQVEEEEKEKEKVIKKRKIVNDFANKFGSPEALNCLWSVDTGQGGFGESSEEKKMGADEGNKKKVEDKQEDEDEEEEEE